MSTIGNLESTDGKPSNEKCETSLFTRFFWTSFDLHHKIVITKSSFQAFDYKNHK